MAEGAIKFVQCLQGYCCEESKEKLCIGTHSCAANREGRICGKYIKHHYVNFFDNKCSPNKNCVHRHWFWVVFAFMVIVLFILVAFYRDIGCILKRCCCCSCCDENSSQNPQNPEDEQLINAENDNDDDPSIFSILFGFIKILFNFYQMKVLIAIAAPSSENNNSIDFLKEILPSIFTLKLTLKNDWNTFCPMENLDVIMKLFIRDVLPTLFLIGAALVLIIYCSLYRRVKQRFYPEDQDRPNDDLTFAVRYKVFLARITIIGYTGITTFLLLLTSYVTIYDNNKPVHVLLINGELKWGEDPWSLAGCVLLPAWGFLFIPTLYFLSLRLQAGKITVDWFLFYLLVPPFYWMSLIARKCRGKPYTGDEVEEPKIKHLLSVFEDQFRKSKATKKVLLWDWWILCRRFIVAFICVYVKDYVVCYVLVIPVLAIFCVHHANVAPYKAKVLNHVEVVSFFSLLAISTINMVWAFFYVYQLPFVDPVSTVVEALKITEAVITFIPFMVFLGYCLYLLCCRDSRCCRKRDR